MRVLVLVFAACVLPLACSEVEDSLDSVPPGPRRTVSKNEPRPEDAGAEAEASVDAALDVLPKAAPAELFVDPEAATQKP